MTCIVGVEGKGGAWIGCDSFWGDSGIKSGAIDRPKIFALGSCAVGYAGSLRVPQILEYGAKVRKIRRGEDALSYLVCAIVPALRRALRTNGALGVSRETPGVDAHEASLLLVLRSEIYTIQGDLAVSRALEGYAATGAGEPFALGSLASTKGRKAEDRVRIALEAAAIHSPYVCGPLHVAGPI